MTAIANRDDSLVPDLIDKHLDRTPVPGLLGHGVHGVEGQIDKHLSDLDPVTQNNDVARPAVGL